MDGDKTVIAVFEPNYTMPIVFLSATIIVLLLIVATVLRIRKKPVPPPPPITS